MTTAVPLTLDYTSRDFDGLRSSLLAYAAQAFPSWTPSSEGDFGVLIVELLAYMGDVLSYYADHAQFEAYLPTATQYQSVVNIASLLGYVPSSGQPAVGAVDLVATPGSPAISVPAGTQVSTAFVSSVDAPIIYEVNANPSSADGSWTVPANNGGATTPLYNVPVTEGQTQANPDGSPASIGTGTGLADQSLRIPLQNVYDNSVQVFVNGVPWTAVPHLIDSGEQDTVFSLSTDSGRYTWVNFGDGTAGAIPPLGSPITASYRVGFGSNGNTAAGAIVSVYSRIPGLSVNMLNANTGTNTVTATGGTDPESIDSIRSSAPRAFSTQQRAVTSSDYESLALGVSGVAKVGVVNFSYASVVLYVVGHDGFIPAAGATVSSYPASFTNLLDSVYTYISPRALAGVTVSVLPVMGSVIDLSDATTGAAHPVAVTTTPSYSNAAVSAAVTQALGSFFSFSNSTLGQYMSVSALSSALTQVPGVQSVSIPLMMRSGTYSGTSVNTDISLNPWELPVLGKLEVVTTGGTTP